MIKFAANCAKGPLVVSFDKDMFPGLGLPSCLGDLRGGAGVSARRTAALRRTRPGACPPVQGCI